MTYLDNAATTRPCGAAVFASGEALETAWFNPSAPYAQALEVEKRLTAVRETLAGALGVPAGGIVFTGSGTEADSLAILGSAARFRGKRKVLLFAGEHPAVFRTADQLLRLGHEPVLFPATKEGVADLDALAALLDETVALVSCMHVNNETGAVQPVEAIGALLARQCPEALFHVDGVQGFLRAPLNLAAGRVSLYAVSAHKLHGPKGVGALAIAGGVRLSPRTEGGGQEGGMRSGTENTAGIAAFGAALGWILAQEDRAERLRTMKLRLFDRIRGEVDGLRVNGPPPESSSSAPHILNVSFPGVGGEVMLHALEGEGVLVGTGAACSTKKRAREMSPAFRAMNAPRWAADSAVRFSFGLLNAPEDADAAAEAALRCWKRYRV